MKPVVVYKSNDGGTYDNEADALLADRVSDILTTLGYTSLPTNVLERDRRAIVIAILDKFDVTPKA